MDFGSQYDPKIGKSDQIRSGQIRSDQIRSDQVRSSAMGAHLFLGLGGVRGLPAMKGWVCVGNPIQILSVV